MGDVRANAIACLLLCGSTLTPAAVSGQTAVPARQTHKVARAASPISVDGVLDEPAWQSATRVPLPYEWFPGDNVPATERTDCYITYDEEKLYVAFRAHDSRPIRSARAVVHAAGVRRRDRFRVRLRGPPHRSRDGFSHRVSRAVADRGELVGYSDSHDGGRQVDLTQINRTFFLKIGYAWIM